jgi:CDP-glycerol glycerophosphotransferase (TagB/SpsB family)
MEKKIIKKYIKIAIMPMEILIFILSHFIPKNKNLIIFSAWGGLGFNDNPRSIFERMILDGVDKKVVWITKSKKDALKITTSGYPCEYSYSFKGIWFQLRAYAVVFTHQVNGEFLSYLISGNVKRVQTCHGIPIKKIDADDSKDKNEKIKYILKKYVFRHLHNGYDLVLSCSKNDQKIFSKAFRTSIDKIKITGYPRNDLLIPKSSTKSLPLQIIYMPTFRGGVNSDFMLLDELILLIDELENLLANVDGYLNIKLHPVQAISSSNLNSISKYKRIKLLANTEPIYNTLNLYDILITDFSSVFFDYLLLNKPIIMAPLRENQYLEFDRGIYYDYEDLCIMKKCLTWQEIIEQIDEIQTKKLYDHNRHEVLLNKFHEYKDADSSKRAYVEILKL